MSTIIFTFFIFFNKVRGLANSTLILYQQRSCSQISKYRYPNQYQHANGDHATYEQSLSAICERHVQSGHLSLRKHELPFYLSSWKIVIRKISDWPLELTGYSAFPPRDGREHWCNPVFSLTETPSITYLANHPLCYCYIIAERGLLSTPFFN